MSQTGISISVQPAEGTKCLRCWRVCKETGYSPRFPGVCARCVQVLHEIRFPAYRLVEGVIEVLPGQVPGVDYDEKWDSEP